jgi:hypothetical protein
VQEQVFKADEIKSQADSIAARKQLADALRQEGLLFGEDG